VCIGRKKPKQIDAKNRRATPAIDPHKYIELILTMKQGNSK
jgi:hypothetical protein